MSSIGFSLGIGSGLDITKLVTDLSNAAKAPKEALIEKRSALNAARVSGIAEVTGAIDNFSSALSSLIAGGSLFTQPTVSDATLLSAKALPGARIGGLTAEIEVVQLARAQVLESAPLTARADPVGEGVLTLSAGGRSAAITIDASNNSLDGLAQAINGSGLGVTASVVGDAGGARLVLKGATGAASAFTLTAADGTTSGLERFAYADNGSGGLNRAQAAQDALVKLDGVSVSGSSNTFNSLIPGLQIDLKRAVPGSIVAIGASRPTEAIEQGVKDFVGAYNELMALIADKTAAGAGGEGGALRGDLGVRALQRQLAQLPTTKLTLSGSGPHTLAEIGVRTNRDGTLSVDAPRLLRALASTPDAVEAMFNPAQFASSAAVTIKSVAGKVKPGIYTLTDLVPASGDASASGKVDGKVMSGIGGNLVAPAGSAAIGMIVGVNAAAASVTITVEPGLGGALNSIRDALRDRTGAFATTSERLKKEASAIADDKALLEARSSKYYNQLLTNFTAMERQVSAFKATQSYLEQQVKIWTADRG